MDDCGDSSTVKTAFFKVGWQGRAAYGFEIGDLILQLANRLLLLASLGLNCGCFAGRRGRRSLRLLPILLGLLQLLSKLLDLLLLRGQGFLLGGQGIFQCLDVGCAYRGLRLHSGCGFVRFSWSRCGRVCGLRPGAGRHERQRQDRETELLRCLHKNASSPFSVSVEQHVSGNYRNFYDLGPLVRQSFLTLLPHFLCK